MVTPPAGSPVGERRVSTQRSFQERQRLLSSTSSTSSSRHVSLLFFLSLPLGCCCCPHPLGLCFKGSLGVTKGSGG